jgi:OCT family organic cation transporter-like MFS transporter 4/5
VCGVVGVFGIAGAYNLIYIYTLELFPTVVRNAALGFTTQAAGVGAILAPTIVSLAHIHPSIPFAIFASVALSNACLGGWLPETVDQPLWDTIEGLEHQELEAKATTTAIINPQP